MKSVLYTGHDESYQPLADMTVPLMREWAVRHRIDFREFIEPPDGLNIFWTGVARGLELLRDGYERVMYLDVDQMITHPIQSLANLPPFGFHCSKDWGSDATETWQFSACGWIAHRDCISMLVDVMAMEPEWRDKPFQEQGPWQEWMRKRHDGMLWFETPETPETPARRTHWRAGVSIHPRRTFNAVPDQVCPGKVPDPWQPGDFAAHLTMVDLPRRIEIFHLLQAQLKKGAC